MKKFATRPNEETQYQVFMNVYEAFKNINLDYKAKYTGFERILFDSKLLDSWPIVGISHQALVVIKENNFSKRNSEIVRGHITPRIVRAKKLFNYEMSTKDAYEYYKKTDEVLLITKPQNSKSVDLKKITIYNIDKGIFPWRSGFSASYTDEALDYLRSLALKNGI